MALRNRNRKAGSVEFLQSKFALFLLFCESVKYRFTEILLIFISFVS